MMLRTMIKRYSYLLVFAVAIIFICITLHVVFADSSYANQSEIDAITISIQEGDTLWSISKEYHQELGVSVQEYIFHLKQLNQLDSDNIFPGQMISLPIVAS